MFYKKAKRVLAGICAFTLMLSGIGENACVAMAAENVQTVIETEKETEKETEEAKEESKEETDHYVEQTDTKDSEGNSIEETSSENNETEKTVSETDNIQTEQETESSETEENETEIETESSQENATESETESVISTETESETEDVIEVTEEVVDNDTETEAEITITNGVSYIWNEESKTMTIVASQGSIPMNAFTNDTIIERIEFEEGSIITNVGALAFSGCKNLVSVDFTKCKDLTSIGVNAFDGCEKLSEVKFSDELQTINSQAFKDCTSLEQITLKKGLISVKNKAFEGCTNLSKVVINTNNISNTTQDSNINYIFKGCSINTIEFGSDMTVVPTVLFRGAGFDENANIVIPNYIQEIGAYAFAGSNLKNITFEDEDGKKSKLTSISVSAFDNCVSLENVVFPESLKIIEEAAFRKCKSITDVSIPDTVTSIGISAFEECTSVLQLKLSNATTTLGKNIFKKCSSLTKVEIPSGITFISEGQFTECTNLNDLTIANTVKSIGVSAFDKCGSLKSVIIPNSVEEIGKYAFSECVSLDNPTLPINIEKLSEGIFDGCLSLSTITIPEKVTEIEKCAFRSCYLLNPLKLPKAITTIGESAFEGCSSIASLEIPENVTTLGKGVFNGCTGIGTLKISSLKITSCKEGAFANCYIRELIFPEGITEIPELLFNQIQFKTATTVTIPKTVTKIGRNAFSGVKEKGNNITAFVFEEGSQLEIIDSNAFCYNNAIESFEIPESTTVIGASAFADCKELKEITIPENITSIGAAAFSGCIVLSTINYNAIAATTSVKNKENAIFKDCNIKKITIGDKVTILPAYLFYGAKFSDNQEETAVFVDLTVPAAVGEIGEYAFANISNIKTVTFEEGSSFEKLGAYAFNSCIGLEKCILPDTVTTIGNSAFRGCTKLKEFTLPDSLITLGNDAFYQCSSMESYVVPENTTVISDNVFFENTSLTTITFKGLNITKIGSNAFNGCIKLKEIDIPQGTASIGMNAFYGCSELGKVRIPASVKEIGEGAFDNCPNVKFYVVNGSEAYKWLVANGFESRIQNMHTITYELNGGINDIRNIGGYLEGDAFTFFAATKPGYDFKGWFLEESLETQVTDLTGQTTDFTLYAKWELATYKITYELDGGTNSEQNPETFTIESKKINLQNPKKAGYSFKGWYKDSEFKTRISNIAAGSTGDITLYAKWEAITYVIKFNANGGAGEKEEIQVIADEAFTIPGSDIFTKEGYVLTGFSTTANGKGEIFKPGESVSAIVESSNKMCVVILYAQWKKFMPNTVEAPVADYESGSELHAGTKITLTTKTKGASIYYTIDGSAPTTSSLLYTDGIIINEPTNLRVFAVKDGFNESVEVVYSYTIIDEFSFWGDITDEDKALYEDATKVPDGIWVAGVQDAVYTGSSIKFELRVYDYKTLLTEKKDYTVKYSNNKKAATKTASKAPVITITAKGDYKGTVKVKFNILPVDISGNDFAAENMYASINGKIQKPIPKLTFGKTKLKNKRDFVVSYPDNPNGFITEGDYKITLTGVGNFTGTRTVDFELKNCTLITKTKVSKIQALNYTGEALMPAVTVTYKGATLVKDTDYIVNYQNNVDAGTASVVITGINNYRGVKTVNFKINPVAQLKKAQITFNKTSVAYTGEAIEFNTGVEPVVETVSYAGMTLVRGEDYVIDSYSKNINKGTATVAFKGIGGYSGVVKKKFKITAASIANAELKFLDASGNIIEGEAEYPYIKGGCKPNILVTYNGKKLVSGTDYTIKYTDNTKQGYASLTLKGKKNFNNELSASFKIGKQDISKLSINVDDLELQSQSTEPISYLSVPVLKDLNGKVLKSGVDYESKVLYTYAIECPIRRNNKNIRVEAGEEVQASDVIPAKTVIRATVNGKGNYEGSISENYVIVSKNISRAVVTVKTQNYTGKAVTPGKSDITVLIDEYKLKDSEYEIIGYEKNISKGTGIVILRGTGNYGGTVKAQFSIKQKNFSLASFINEFFS